MATITTLADPWVVRIIAHEFAKVRNDLPSRADAEGNVTMIPNKKKFTHTSAVLAAKYGLITDAKLIKNNKVTHCYIGHSALHGQLVITLSLWAFSMLWASAALGCYH
jgi:hypothetical protein